MTGPTVSTGPVELRTLTSLEACYDALPRPFARAQDVGPLRLFVREGPGWAYYARPAAPFAVVTPAEVLAVRGLQRELGVPEAFEWVHELVPTLAAAAEQAGLEVRLCPLLVLDAGASLPPAAPGIETELLDADSPDLVAAERVAAVAFGHGGTAPGRAGPVERDALVDAEPSAEDAARDEAVRAAIRSGASARVVGRLPADPALPGPLAVAGFQHALSTAEIIGVATLPAARRRGLAGAVTAHLAAHARDRGMRLVFLSAQDDAVARVYQRVGFRRVGTAALAEPALRG